MEKGRKIEILDRIRIFFINHQKYEMAAYLRDIKNSIDGNGDVNIQYYLSEKIPEPSINNIEEYEFVISIIDEYPTKGHFVNQTDFWTVDQYKNLINTKRIKRLLMLNRIGI